MQFQLFQLGSQSLHLIILITNILNGTVPLRKLGFFATIATIRAISDYALRIRTSPFFVLLVVSRGARLWFLSIVSGLLNPLNFTDRDIFTLEVVLLLL